MEIRKMNKSISIVLGIVMILGSCIVSAEQQSLGVFKQNTCITLKQTCANCTFVNLTSVYNPNGIEVTGVFVMTKIASEYSYSFCNATILGQYIYNTLGDPNGIPTTQPVTFDVTSTGNDKDLYLPLLLGIGGMLLLISGIFVRNAFLGLFSAFLFIILGVYSLIYGLGIINDAYTQMISYVIIGLGTVIGFASVYELYEEGTEY
jgi:hypothetical protein